MGTYGTGILDNDTSGEVYEKFIELLDKKTEIPEILDIINSDFSEYKTGKHSKTDFLFAVGLALWENCSLDQSILNQVKSFINSGTDIKIWRDLDSSEEDIKLRKKKLAKFLKKIEKPRKKPLGRNTKKVIYKPPIFKTGDCIVFKVTNENYSGAIVVGEHKIDIKEMGSNVIISTDINQKEKPTREDFTTANVLITNFGVLKNWIQISEFSADYFKDFSSELEIVDNIEIKQEVSDYYRENFCGYSPWNYLISNIVNELKRKPVRRKIKTLSIKDVLIDLKLKETKNKI